MKGDLLLVLLLATGVASSAQADKKPGAEHAAAAAKKHVKTEAVKAQKEAPAKTKPAQEGTAEAQAETKKQPGQAEAAQVKTEAGPDGRTPGTNGPRSEVDLRPRRKGAGHVHSGQSGSAHVAGHRSLEELGSWPRDWHLADARRLQAARRQGSFHAGAALLRDQVGKEAVSRPFAFR